MSKTPTNQEQQLPMFYNSVELLNAEKHGDLRVNASAGYEFASRTNAVAVSVAEMPDAVLDYPVVFASGKTPMAMAILGLYESKNAFISDEGDWKDGAYIPAYVRRYPYVIISSDDNQQYALGVDVSAKAVAKKVGVPLFTDTKPTDVAQKALEFCISYKNDMDRSVSVYKEIEKSGILVDRNAQVSRDGDKNSMLKGFRIVDEEKFNKLSAPKITSLRKAGALGVIYAHLISMRNWNRLPA